MTGHVANQRTYGTSKSINSGFTPSHAWLSQDGRGARRGLSQNGYGTSPASSSSSCPLSSSSSPSRGLPQFLGGFRRSPDASGGWKNAKTLNLRSSSLLCAVSPSLLRLFPPSKEEDASPPSKEEDAEERDGIERRGHALPLNSGFCFLGPRGTC